MDDSIDRWVIPRADCLFYRHNFVSVPEKQRSSALHNHLNLLSPFPEFGYWVYWQGAEALIWLWDKDRLVSVQGKHFSENTPDKLHDIPESALTTQCVSGVTYYELEQGYLGQYWQEGRLLGDYWWPAVPTPDEWQLFLKSVGANFTQLPKSQELAQSPHVLWPTSASWDESARKLEIPLLQVCGVIMAFFLFYFGAGTIRLMATQWQMENTLSIAQSQGQATVNLREQAYQRREKNLELISLSGNGQLTLILAVAEALPESAGTILRWNYADGNLEVLLSDEAPDLADYVGRLEGQLPFSQVTAEPASQGKQVLLKMEVQGG